MNPTDSSPTSLPIFGYPNGNGRRASGKPDVEAAESRTVAGAQSAPHAGADAYAAGMTEHVPAWRRESSGELRWPVTAVVLLTVMAQLTIPEDFSLGDPLVMPAVELTMLAVLVALNPGAIRKPHLHLRWLSIALTATMSLANAVQAVRLISAILEGTASDNAFTVLRVGGTVWLVNVVVMALWYWELDRGGASARARNVHERTDFLFPQMTATQFAHKDWEPAFLDYFYTSFTNASAFSPTDVLPLTRWAKMLMLLQSVVSLTTVALIIARAVNTLR